MGVIFSSETSGGPEDGNIQKQSRRHTGEVAGCREVFFRKVGCSRDVLDKGHNHKALRRSGLIEQE
jgi:hypothetical protein